MGLEKEADFLCVNYSFRIINFKDNNLSVIYSSRYLQGKKQNTTVFLGKKHECEKILFIFPHCGFALIRMKNHKALLFKVNKGIMFGKTGLAGM